MDADIQKHLQECHRCQVRRTRHHAEPPMLLTPLAQCTEPQQIVHADLFGPLKTETSKKYFTVATTLFERWICRFRVPLEIITDQGKEFCAKLTKDLFQLLQITHSTTTAYHPQCNRQAEVANKTIAKYLTSYVSEATLDWEDYLAPMMFSYSTSFHRSDQNTLFFLTHGMEARQPKFDVASNRIRMKGPKPSQEILDRLYEARQRAINANQDATATAQEYHDRRAEPYH